MRRRCGLMKVKSQKLKVKRENQNLKLKNQKF